MDFDIVANIAGHSLYVVQVTSAIKLARLQHCSYPRIVPSLSFVILNLFFYLPLNCPAAFYVLKGFINNGRNRQAIDRQLAFS